MFVRVRVGDPRRLGCGGGCGAGQADVHPRYFAGNAIRSVIQAGEAQFLTTKVIKNIVVNVKKGLLNA